MKIINLQIDKWLLADMRLCIDKNFKLIDCSLANQFEVLPHVTQCPRNDIYYIPRKNIQNTLSNALLENFFLLTQLLKSFFDSFFNSDKDEIDFNWRKYC